MLNDEPTAVSDRPIERNISRTLWTSAKGSKAKLHTSTSGRTMFELWSWVLMPGDVFAADAHSPDTRELLSVTQGSLKVTVGSDEIILMQAKVRASLQINPTRMPRHPTCPPTSRWRFSSAADSGFRHPLRWQRRRHWLRKTSQTTDNPFTVLLCTFLRISPCPIRMPSSILSKSTRLVS
ncbi:hypothetical protein BPNPMPFG_007566 (plasmid) [Mesorhizobium sp. AR07]|uniref:hypothetical protein n=1 Tax=Mesorhizobium sp. AR07 TaxID=2865838 RepID=UPI0021605E64|nr:hypothetical protein [Mesorhizobium sp. AR07]UVK48316.1 hypothetical protein BPNPMPFG_007566 [Mesorhizobium sp. AR07]